MRLSFSPSRAIDQCRRRAEHNASNDFPRAAREAIGCKINSDLINLLFSLYEASVHDGNSIKINLTNLCRYDEAACSERASEKCRFFYWLNKAVNPSCDTIDCT